MRDAVKVILMLAVVVALSGCNTVSKALPPNDEALLYKLPYDLTYLRAMEAIDAQEHWELEETEMTKGIIKARNSNYSNLDDADLRVIAFTVKRVDEQTVSVSILPQYQRVPGGDVLLKAVAERLGREVRT